MCFLQVAKAELPQKVLQKKYPKIKGFHNVSSITGQGIEGLKEAVLEETLKESSMGAQVPTVYLNLERKIQQYVDSLYFYLLILPC